VFSSATGGRVSETSRLAGVSYNPVNQPPIEEQLRAVRGAIEDLGRVIGGKPLSLEASAGASAPWQTAGQWLAVRQGDRPAGGLGVLTGPILETVAQEGQVVWFELAMDQISGPIFPELKYVAPPIYPGSWQDFSLVWDVARGFAALDARLDRFSHPLVMRREFLTVYKGKGLPPGKGSYSFRYWLGFWDRTLTSDEIEQFRTALLAFLEQEGIPLRG
jgi:phenylalanyl-tRNA synthetase beta chain